MLRTVYVLAGGVFLRRAMSSPWEEEEEEGGEQEEEDPRDPSY